MFQNHKKREIERKAITINAESLFPRKHTLR